MYTVAYKKDNLNKYMSYQEYIKQIERELKRLNKVIDYKILNGERYTDESKEHKNLLKIIKNNKPVKSNFFTNFFSSAF